MYGGRKPQAGYLYAGPDQSTSSQCARNKVPTFEELVKNRLLNEHRFFANNSNSKWLSLGIVPATKILNDEARGFYMEAFLCGDKCMPMPVGGVVGLATLFDTIKKLPGFGRFPVVEKEVEPADNIQIETCNFNENVSKLS